MEKAIKVIRRYAPLNVVFYSSNNFFFFTIFGHKAHCTQNAKVINILSPKVSSSVSVFRANILQRLCFVQIGLPQIFT